MTRLHRIRHEAGLVAIALLVSFAVGAAYVAIREWRMQPWDMLRGGLNGVVIAVACITTEAAVLRKCTRLPFGLAVIARTIVLAVVGVSMLLLFYALTTGSMAAFTSDKRRLLVTVVLTLAISFVANLIVLMRRALGRQAFLALLTGKYRKPVEEIRMFLFLDLALSTSVAEKIGDVKYHRLIHRFWCDITDAILASRGEIYQYVGDEVIVTWRLGEAKPDDRWLVCVFAIRNSIEAKRDKYLEDFGIFPEFRVSLHCGMVVTGEVGDCNREISFLGDTVNTAARILDMCKEKKHSLLVSDEVVRRIPDPTRYELQPIPDVSLRGKERSIGLYAVKNASG